jgi:hypothetical protein
MLYNEKRTFNESYSELVSLSKKKRMLRSTGNTTTAGSTIDNSKVSPQSILLYVYPQLKSLFACMNNDTVIALMFHSYENGACEKRRRVT